MDIEFLLLVKNMRLLQDLHRANGSHDQRLVACEAERRVDAEITRRLQLESTAHAQARADEEAGIKDGC